MQPKDRPSACSAVVGSMTQAMRAKRLLVEGRVMARVIKADPSASEKGCAYAVTFPCARREEAYGILHGAGIRFRGGGG